MREISNRNVIRTQWNTRSILAFSAMKRKHGVFVLFFGEIKPLLFSAVREKFESFAFGKTSTCAKLVLFIAFAKLDVLGRL